MLTQAQLLYYRTKWITNLDQSLEEIRRDTYATDDLLLSTFNRINKANENNKLRNK